MVRPSEAAAAEWAEIDLDAKLWTIPASRMKKKRQHTVPLSPEMIEILEEMRVISQPQYVYLPFRGKTSGEHEFTNGQYGLKENGL